MARLRSYRRAILVVGLGIATAMAVMSAPTASPRSRAVTDRPGNTLSYRLAAGRILVQIGMLRTDGSERAVLAWLNMGTPKMALSTALARDLEATSGRPLKVRFADVEVDVAPGLVEIGAPKLDGESVFDHLFAPLPVEAILPASVLQRYQLVLDFAARQVTLASPGTCVPQGTATPLLLNPDTGVVAVEATVAGEPHRLAIDAGASFTWLRGDLVRGWLAEHPNWRRAEGAVGASNMGLTSLAFERRGTLFRLPDTVISGQLTLPDIEALGTAPLICGLCDRVVGDLFWDGWERNAPAPVAGWLGNNVLGDFKLTFDYPNRTLYWLRQRQDASRDINMIGVTLVRRGDSYAIGGLVEKNGHPSIVGVEEGDALLAVDGVATNGRSSDDVLKALSGHVGATHVLDLERGGGRIRAEMPVAEF